jgi:hypothetical protein
MLICITATGLTRMPSQTALIFILAVAFFAPAHAGELEGDQLYRVTTVRAAAGSLADLLDSIALRRPGERPPLVMRHSQGDHWDLMLISAIDSESAMDPAFLAPRSDLVAFEEDHFAYGPPWADVSSAYEENSFYHIEMFEAVAGKAEQLLEQRRMENNYLGATGLKPNMIFRRAAGSDVDAFTIGFHEDMEAFAAPSDVSDEDKEAAAVDAGFKARSDISFYLRTLISGHHDTLAVRVD